MRCGSLRAGSPERALAQPVSSLLRRLPTEEQSRLGCNHRRAAQPTHKDRRNWIAHNVSNRDACFRKMDSTASTQDVCPCQSPYFEADRRLRPRRQASGISRLTASDENCNRAARVRQALVFSEASEIPMPIIGGDKSRVVALWRPTRGPDASSLRRLGGVSKFAIGSCTARNLFRRHYRGPT